MPFSIFSCRPFVLSVIENKLLLAVGQAISKEDYPRLYSIMQDGGVGIYGEDPTTFNLPDLRGPQLP